MPDPCETCAFREDCETFGEPLNRLKSMICAMSGLPFYCHKGHDWRNTHIANMTNSEVKEFRSSAQICEGWRRAIRERVESGAFTAAPIRRYFGREAIRLIDKFLSVEEPEKSEALGELEKVIELLAREPEAHNSPATVRSGRNAPCDSATERNALPAVQPG
jgi:hypothetical protein